MFTLLRVKSHALSLSCHLCRTSRSHPQVVNHGDISCLPPPTDDGLGLMLETGFEIFHSFLLSLLYHDPSQSSQKKTVVGEEVGLGHDASRDREVLLLLL